LNRRIFTSFLFLGALAGCARMPDKQQAKKSSAGPVALYPLEGTVVRLDPAAKTASVKHGALKDQATGKVWMEAMTMDFPVPDAAEFAKLKEGMQIKATVHNRESEMEYWLAEIQPQN
jgi:Cu/Ag efflux protein CusF